MHFARVEYLRMHVYYCFYGMKLDAIFVVPIIFVEVAKKGNLWLDSASIMIIGTKNPQLLFKIQR